MIGWEQFLNNKELNEEKRVEIKNSRKKSFDCDNDYFLLAMLNKKELVTEYISGKQLELWRVG